MTSTLNHHRLQLDRASLKHVLLAAGIERRQVRGVHELEEGTYNTTYRIALADRGVVLKIAPSPAAPALTYEHDLLSTETLFYRDPPAGVPLPEVLRLDTDRALLEADWLLTSERRGANWHLLRDRITERDRARLRTDLGRVVAALHTRTGSSFGYPHRAAAPPRSDSWHTAFLAMLDAVLADADRFSVCLPRPVAEIRDVLWERTGPLAQVRTPVLVHFDLWDGNMLVDVNSGTGQPEISGIVDGERAFWGDPLADLVSLALYGDIERDEAFLTGYRAAGGTVEFDDATRTRLSLYRCYLYLIMLVEGAPRGYAGEKRDATVRLVGDCLLRELDR